MEERLILKVTNIAPNVTFNDFKNLFKKFKKYGKTKLHLEKPNGNNKTFGYATFKKEYIAQKALTKLNNSDQKGSLIQVKFKKN